MAINHPATHASPSDADERDIFLSHRSSDKEHARRLTSDIESETYRERNLLAWLDEAEIRPGQSIPGAISHGLERSRFIGLIVTPSYFAAGSGWTDAEWHAALHGDPDNRQTKILPLLFEDCPYIPYLLRHLRMIDFRGSRYSQGLKELLSMLREEPLPRPKIHRGQLITADQHIEHETLVAERAVSQAYPDAISERLCCNLLRVERLPQYLYIAAIKQDLCMTGQDGTLRLPSKQVIKERVRVAQTDMGIENPVIPAFRVVQGQIVTFHDLESPEGLLIPVIEESKIQKLTVTALMRDEDDRKIIISLLNMAIARHVASMGLTIDETKDGKFFFPPKNGGPNVLSWIPVRRRSERTVAKPCYQDGNLVFWRHLGAYVRMLFLANKLYLHIIPTWVITEDGVHVRSGPDVGKLVIKWTGPERNLHLLYHLRFWATVLRRQPGPISIRAGDQWMEVATNPASVEQTSGIASDQRDLMQSLDQEAMLIAEQEDELADLQTAESVESASEESETEELAMDYGGENDIG